jgi:uncharacterized protein YjbI with pentapeptide repeats
VLGRRKIAAQTLQIPMQFLVGSEVEITYRAGSMFELANVDLRKANLCKAFLYATNFAGANLEQADLMGANLSWANLNNAILRRTKLDKANLEFTLLSGADLDGAELFGAINLEKAFLIGARPGPTTIWPDGFKGVN